MLAPPPPPPAAAAASLLPPQLPAPPLPDLVSARRRRLPAKNPALTAFGGSIIAPYDPGCENRASSPVSVSGAVEESWGGIGVATSSFLRFHMTVVCVGSSSMDIYLSPSKAAAGPDHSPGKRGQRLTKEPTPRVREPFRGPFFRRVFFRASRCCAEAMLSSRRGHFAAPEANGQEKKKKKEVPTAGTTRYLQKPLFSVDDAKIMLSSDSVDEFHEHRGTVGGICLPKQPSQQPPRAPLVELIGSIQFWVEAQFHFS